MSNVQLKQTNKQKLPHGSHHFSSKGAGLQTIQNYVDSYNSLNK